MSLANPPWILHKPHIEAEEISMLYQLSSIAFSLLLCLPALAAEVATTHRGLTLKANLEMADGKSMKDGVVLMTHGTLAHGRMEIMSTLQDNLKTRGYNTLSINLSYAVNNRPFVMHECAQPQVHRHEDAVDEIAAWVSFLKSKGAGRIILLGHSRGSNQTAWYAAEKPDAAVKAAILIAPGSWTEAELATDYKKRFGLELKPVLDDARKRIKAGKGKDWLPKTSVLYCKDAQTTAETLASYHAYDSRLATFDLIKKMPMPVLVIAGSADEITPGVAEKTRLLGDGKRIHLVSIEGADHFFRDLYGEEAADAISTFLKGQNF
jgi:pimeloyl-ACP methyl ester carboxylesterase